MYRSKNCTSDPFNALLFFKFPFPEEGMTDSANLGRKQVEEFLNVVGIIFPIKHWNCADNQNDSGLLAESSFQ